MDIMSRRLRLIVRLTLPLLFYRVPFSSSSPPPAASHSSPLLLLLRLLWYWCVCLQLRLYDLNVNKHEPVGETRVVKKAKLTHVCFNPKEPVVLVSSECMVSLVKNMQGD